MRHTCTQSIVIGGKRHVALHLSRHALTLELAVVIHEGSYAGPGQNSIHFAHCSVVVIKIRPTCKRVTILNPC